MIEQDAVNIEVKVVQVVIGNYYINLQHLCECVHLNSITKTLTLIFYLQYSIFFIFYLSL